MTSRHPRHEWKRRYQAFADRKERDARESTLRPFETELDNGGPGLTRIMDSWSQRLFDGPFYASRVRSQEPDASARQTLPAVSLVFVQSRSGNTGAADPSALGGGETDKHLIYEGLSRVAADGALAGAETIHGGDVLFSVWRDEMCRLRSSFGKPRHPVQIVATLRGLSFDDTLLYNVPDIRVIILTVADCAHQMRADLAARPWITPVVMADKDDLRSAFGELRRIGIERISVVGGRTIATALIDAGLVQDLYLTTTPREGGQPNTPMYPKPLDADIVVRKRGTSEDVGVVFEHRLLRSA